MKNLSRYEFKKQVIRKKTSLSIFYGLIFLVSTIAFYFVNSSSAQNIVDLEFAITDKDLVLDNYVYQEKASMEEEHTSFILPATQNNLVVSEYIKINEKDVNAITEYLQGIQENGQTSDIETPEIIENDEEALEVENTYEEEILSDKSDSNDAEVVENTDEIVNDEIADNEDVIVEGAEDEIESNTDDTEAIVENTDDSTENIEAVNTGSSEEIIENNDSAVEEKTDEIIDNSNDDTEEIVEEIDNAETVAEDIVDNKVSSEVISKAEFINKLVDGKKVLYPGEELSISLDDLNGKTVYLIAKYNKKEVNNKIFYEKKLSQMTETNLITVSGYMPLEAELKVEEVSVSNVEEQIKQNQGSDEDIKLAIAYDIKILVGEIEYQPEDFGEDVKVEIEGLRGEKVKVWHLGDDESLENFETDIVDDTATFETSSFSIYGVEILEDGSDSSDEIKNESKISDSKDGIIEDIKAEPNAAKGGPLRAPAPNLPHSTLEIDDYDSDYYYYMGKNYTDNIAGTNANTYSSSNLVKVTLNYYGYAQADASNNEKIGRISLTETQDCIKNIKCVPVSGGNVTIELMENPFMDKPTGYGFGGWTPSTGTVTQNSQTLTYSVTATASNNMTINLYANWTTARVVYLNPTTGCDNLASDGYDGSTPEKPLGSWQAACNQLYTLAGNTTNRNDRENNIIVLTGDIDSSINYTRPITGTINHTLISADITYNNNVAFTTGTSLIISNNATAIGSNALSGNGGSLANATITSSLPSAGTRWTIGGSSNAYSIRNDEGYYLTASNSSNSTLSLSTTSFSSWRYDTTNNKFYYRYRRYNGNYYYFYLYYNNGTWTFYTRQNATGNYGTRLYFHTYTLSNEVYEDVFTNSAGSLGNNSYYSSTRNLALTVTSLYNHEDYRQNAVMTLTNSNYYNTTVYKDIQFDFVNITANNYRVDTNGTTASGPYFYGNSYNCRIGRGMYPLTNTGTGASTFGTIYGGATSGDDVGSTTNDNNAYKLVVESGKYTQMEGFHGTGSNSYYGTIYVVWGNDIDRAKKDNDQLKNYNRCSVNRASGVNGKNSVRNPAFIINVKSGTFGHDYIADYSTSDEIAYAGIYVGGHGTSASSSARDISDRHCIVEGGNIANIIGGLKLTSGTSVQTRIYVKGGTVKNIVGGAGVSQTYGDRIIQVTGGTVQYSISGGSNGVHASSTNNNGRLNADMLVYVGGDAQIGTSTTVPDVTDETTIDELYNVKAGCVLGAGNGTSNTTYNATSGQVASTHVIINDEAHILNSVYGGGNYGIVGTSGSTTATAKIEILGGTIDGNVYGGANQNNIYGSTIIDVKDGQVKGAIYGGSNTKGTISSNTTITITGGTLGQSTNTTANSILFGGGYGSNTTVTGNATINIRDTDNNVEMYGSAYGGSAQGTISGNTVVNIQDSPSVANTISITGNVFAGGQGTNTQAATVNGNSTINVNGSNLPNASIFGGNDVNGTTNGNITVNIGQAQNSYSSTVGNVYGAGNVDSTGTEADTVKVYLYPGANVTNAFNGGKNASLTTSGVNDTSRAIYLEGGHADNIFGGSDAGGTVTASHVYINSGTAGNVYGGNNQGGQTTASYVYINGGTVTDVYGGGYQATTPTTNVSLVGGTITNGFGGGKSANVTTSNIVLNGTTAGSIYGGSNQLGTVTTSNVTITSGTVTNVYGGNNQGGDTVTTNVNVNSPATTVYGGGNQAQTSGNTNVYVTSNVGNVYGGGNSAITLGDTYVKLTNATVSEDAFGGGNGHDAVVSGDSTIIVEGTTNITGDLFGGGNAAANGSVSNATSTVTTLITGGTIGGDVYGAANTSVVYGDAIVKIGSAAVNNNTLTQRSISIGGTVFGGGKSNTAGSSNYDFTFESVTGDVNIIIDATGYDNGTYTFNIGRSVFGSGNAAKISGDGYVTIKNYGSASAIKENISIQRATSVTLDHCYIHLEGTTDRTNEIATAVYTFNRIDDLILKNSTTLYLDNGVNITAKLESLDSSGAKETVQIGQNGITSQTANNRIYLSQGKNIILKTEDGSNGEVKGMAFVGLFKETISNTGIYGTSYSDGNSIPSAVREIFERNSYVQGKHYASHDIEVDGFYTNYDVEGVIDTRFIEPTPDNADYYQWIAGKISTDIYYENIELIATKYATTASYVLSLDGLSFPNTVVKVVGFDASRLNSSVSLNNPTTIPKIAATAQDADTYFGLTMTAGTTGWQTRGTTNYINNSQVTNDFIGTDEYLSDNSTTTPTFSFYMDHSKNISSTGVLGTVTIQLEVSYVDANDEMQIRNAYIIIKLTTNNTVQGQDYYEGAITPGVQYSVFPTITTNITDKSTFSAYYSLYIGNYSQTNYYYDANIPGYAGMYYHDITTTCVLPANTKITLIDTTNSQYRYYYYIVSSADANANKTIFKFTDFKCMDSTQEPYSSDGIYYNSSLDLFFEEFIVQVNFEDTNIQNNLTSERIFIELRDDFDDTVAITVNSAQFPMLFSVYQDIPVTANIDLTLNKQVIYMGESLNLGIETEYSYNRNEDLDIVYDTTHIENQLGVRITISTGSDVLTSQNLEGIYIRHNNKNYYARSDGSYRIKLADAVANVLTDMTLYTSNGSLATGTYIITAQSFGSVDGIYFSTPIDSDSKQVQIVNTNYGFKVDMNANAVLIDGETGINKNDTNSIAFTIGYSGYFPNAEIRVSLYRRDYTTVTSYDYNLVNLANYVTNTLTATAVTNEYLVTDTLQTSQTFTLLFDEGLTTGTYKVRFTLYDNDILIDNIDKSIIIK